MESIELFAGVGGFRLGLERAGHSVVWANEWDRYACDTYDKNFGGQIDRRDITTIPATDIPAHDLIAGGFPCQAFSVAGKRKGFADIRGTLFFEIARIAKHHKTPYLLLENVRGLLSHDKGRTFATILRTLDDLGYDCQWQVCNSKDFGVPQNRERVIIVGHTRDRRRPEVFPLGEGNQPHDAERVLAHTLNSSDWRGGNRNQKQTTIAVETSGVVQPEILAQNPGVHQDCRVYDPPGVSPTLAGSAVHPMIASQGVNHPSRGIEPRRDGLAATVKSGESGTKKPKAVVNGVIRRLTPIECERLQGFPDNWTEGVSDTQRYKQMGNAVTVNVIEAVARCLPVNA
jgi:DNA (cytosine-5)-methyltransferase 1